MKTLWTTFLLTLLSACAAVPESGNYEYDVPNWLRLDVLVVEESPEVARAIQSARASWTGKAFRALPLDVYRLTREGKAQRADGCVSVSVRFKNPGSSNGPFFAHRYPDAKETEKPSHTETVVERDGRPGLFEFLACNGRGSLAVPYGYITSRTVAEVTTSAPTFYPYEEVGKAVEGKPGELYEAVRAGKIWDLWLLVLSNGRSS